MTRYYRNPGLLFVWFIVCVISFSMGSILDAQTLTNEDVRQNGIIGSPCVFDEAISFVCEVRGMTNWSHDFVSTDNISKAVLEKALTFAFSREDTLVVLGVIARAAGASLTNDNKGACVITDAPLKLFSGEKARLEEIKQWNTKIKLTSSIKLGTFLESLQLHHNRTDRDLFGISFVIVGSSKKELKSLLEGEIDSGEKNLGELLLGCLKKAGWACRNDSGCLIVTKMAEITATTLP